MMYTLMMWFMLNESSGEWNHEHKTIKYIKLVLVSFFVAELYNQVFGTKSSKQYEPIKQI